MIGVGAIGRQVAILLAASGASFVTLYDPDKVGEENIGVQGYADDDLHEAKVDATRRAMRQFDRSIGVAKPCRFESDSVAWDRLHQMLGAKRAAVFICVDSIEARKAIHEKLMKEKFFGDGEGRGLIVDGRMAAETMKVIAFDPNGSFDYKSTLFGKEDAYQAPCTGRTTLYTCYIAAGLMVGEFVKWLRDEEPTPMQTFNVRASEHWVQTDMGLRASEHRVPAE